VKKDLLILVDHKALRKKKRDTFYHQMQSSINLVLQFFNSAEQILQNSWITASLLFLRPCCKTFSCRGNDTNDFRDV